MGYACKLSEDLVAALIRKQIDELIVILGDLETHRFCDDNILESLKRVEQQIRWLRKEGLDGFLTN